MGQIANITMLPTPDWTDAGLQPTISLSVIQFVVYCVKSQKIMKNGHKKFPKPKVTPSHVFTVPNQKIYEFTVI